IEHESEQIDEEIEAATMSEDLAEQMQAKFLESTAVPGRTHTPSHTSRIRSVRDGPDTIAAIAADQSIYGAAPFDGEAETRAGPHCSARADRSCRRRDSPGGTSSHKNCERPYRSKHTISPSRTRFSPAMNVSYVISWARSHANQEESSIHSRRDGNSCRNWDETARVIRFTLMSTHTVDSPVSCNSTNRYFVARCNASLPV